MLNLYAGIGGNRWLWENVEVTAVEINPEIAEIYPKWLWLEAPDLNSSSAKAESFNKGYEVNQKLI